MVLLSITTMSASLKGFLISRAEESSQDQHTLQNPSLLISSFLFKFWEWTISTTKFYLLWYFKHCCSAPYFPKFLDTKGFSFCIIFLIKPLNFAMCYSIHTVQGVFSKNILRRRVSSSEQVRELIKETSRSTSTIWHAENKETIILLKWIFFTLKIHILYYYEERLTWNSKCFSKTLQIKEAIMITRWILERSNSTSWHYHSKFHWINQCHAKFHPRFAKWSLKVWEPSVCLAKALHTKPPQTQVLGWVYIISWLWSTLIMWNYLRASISPASTCLD